MRKTDERKLTMRDKAMIHLMVFSPGDGVPGVRGVAPRAWLWRACRTVCADSGVYALWL